MFDQITCFGTKDMIQKCRNAFLGRKKNACGTQQATKSLKILAFLKMFIIRPQVNKCILD